MEDNTGGIWQGDVIIKAMIDQSLDEMKNNPWLLDDVFKSLMVNKYVAAKVGKKNIDSAKEWLANNQVNVYVRPRNDKDQTPMVTIRPLQSNEKAEMKTMGDMSTERKILKPLEIGKPIPYIVKPFTPTGLDQANGLIMLPIKTPGIEGVSSGQFIVDPETGTGYVIEGVVGVDSDTLAIVVQQGLIITATQLGIVPQFQYYEARVENTYNQETYSIACYAHGDPQVLIWLHSIVLYGMLRYRQTLLEGTGFAESVISSGEIGEDPNFKGPGGEECFVRFITLTGQVQQTWIKAPQRFIESITGDLQIISNLNAPDQILDENPDWTTIEDLDE